MVREREREATDVVASSVETDQHRKPWERYLKADLGLRNHWYPAFFSEELAEGETRAETICGERIIFKRADGKVHGIEDRCAHRGIAFSDRPECYTKNTVTCWFHGFTYDVRDGKLVQVLTEANSAIVGKLKLRAYPTHELNKVVFVFIGDGDPPPPDTDIQPKFHNKKLAFKPLARIKIKCNWRVAAENGFDAAHIYGHRFAELFKHSPLAVPLSTYPTTKDIVKTVDIPNGPKGIIKQDDISVFEAEVEGVKVRAANYPEDAPAVVAGELFPIWVGVYLPCGLEVDPFPNTGMIHFEWYVPIDDEYHMYTIIQSQYVEDEVEERKFYEETEKLWGPLVFQRPGVEPEGFNNFDAFGRKHSFHSYQNEGWWRRERLFKPDYVIMEWRKLVSTHARGIQTWGDWQRKKPDEDEQLIYPR
ncbi:MAG: Rieske 2Fe-2S domain-containing protein [SAR202 cluster bacterium]|nr:Rieske 2Fe-2S domain-containing protein [SAR202 cluster bacterium]